MNKNNTARLLSIRFSTFTALQNSQLLQWQVRLLLLLLPLMLAVLVAPSWAQTHPTTRASSKILVMVDAGHGGEDDGTHFARIKEKDVALSVALELKKILMHDPDFDVVLTRETDVFIPLDVRSQKAENAKADVFISIHANSSTSTRARGTEFYFENQNPTDEESLFLANRENSSHATPSGTAGPEVNADLSNIISDLVRNEHIIMSQQLSQNLLEAFQKGLKIKTRALRQAPFRVLGVTMPATLIEVGFLSNSEEAHWLNQQATQRQMAHAVYLGLRSFKEKLDKIRPAPVK